MGVAARFGLAAVLLMTGSPAVPRAMAQDTVAGAGAASQDMPPPAMGGKMVRGTVVATGPDQLTIKADTGETMVVATSANTRIRKGREAVKFADIHPGDGVGAMGEVDPATYVVHALFVAVIDAEQLKKLREEMGKSYIAGKITAIDETKLTILRTDQVSQTIEVDEDTSFRKGGRMPGGFGAGFGQGGSGPPPPDAHRGPRPATPDELLTLADLKTGDIVGGEGSLKRGVFVPRELRVFDPASQGRRRRGSDPATAGKTATDARPLEPR